MTLPASLRRRSDVDAIWEDIEPYLGTTIDERSRIMSDLCEYAAEQIAAHPRGQEINDYQDPRSPKSLALWLRLVRAARHP